MRRKVGSRAPIREQDRIPKLSCGIMRVHEPRVVEAALATGRVALTNYLMQSCICTLAFRGIGFGKFGTLERSELYYVVLDVWVFQLAVSPLWLKYFASVR